MTLERTAHLARLCLSEPQPTPEQEAASLRKAQTAWERQGSRPAAPLKDEEPQNEPPQNKEPWWKRLWTRPAGREANGDG